MAARYRKLVKKIAEGRRPENPWNWAKFQATFYHWLTRRRDPDNFQAALKAAVDGLVEARVLQDDRDIVYYPVRFLKAKSKDWEGVVITLETSAKNRPFVPSARAVRIARQIEVLVTNGDYVRAIGLLEEAKLEVDLDSKEEKARATPLKRFNIPDARLRRLALAGIETVGQAVDAWDPITGLLESQVLSDLESLDLVLAQFLLKSK